MCRDSKWIYNCIKQGARVGEDWPVSKLLIIPSQTRKLRAAIDEDIIIFIARARVRSPAGFSLCFFPLQNLGLSPSSEFTLHNLNGVFFLWYELYDWSSDPSRQRILFIYESTSWQTTWASFMPLFFNLFYKLWIKFTPHQVPRLSGPWKSLCRYRRRGEWLYDTALRTSGTSQATDTLGN